MAVSLHPLVPRLSQNLLRRPHQLSHPTRRRIPRTGVCSSWFTFRPDIFYDVFVSYRLG